MASLLLVADAVLTQMLLTDEYLNQWLAPVCQDLCRSSQGCILRLACSKGIQLGAGFPRSLPFWRWVQHFYYQTPHARSQESAGQLYIRDGDHTAARRSTYERGVMHGTARDGIVRSDCSEPDCQQSLNRIGSVWT